MKKTYKTILITGASSGLGRELAIQYANKGIILYLTGRNKSRLLDTVNICQDKGASVLSKDIDIKDKESLYNWIVECDKLHNIDLIIANAGISAGTSCNKEDSSQVYDIYETNIIGVLNTIQPIIPLMIKRRQGQIALISSMSK